MQNKLPKILLGVFALSLITSMFLYIKYSTNKPDNEKSNNIQKEVVVTDIEVTESTQSAEVQFEEISALLEKIQGEFELEFSLIRDCEFEWQDPPVTVKGKCTKLNEVSSIYENRIIDFFIQNLFQVDSSNSSGSAVHNKTGLLSDGNTTVCLVESTVSSYDPTLQLTLSNLNMSEKNISISCGYLY